MKSLLALFLPFFVLSSCSMNSEEDPANPGLEFPLKVGNSWVFEVQGEHSIRLDTLTVTKDTLINDQNWFFLSESDRPSSSLLNVTFRGYYTSYNSALYFYSGEETISDNTPIFQTNLQIGDTYLNDTGSVWKTTYNGEGSDASYGSTYSYSVEYLSMMRHSTTYDFDQPYEFERTFSPEVGFVHWGTGYFRSTRKDTTITLTVAEKVDLQLKEFIESE